MNSSADEGPLSWMYAGVDLDLPGTGGDDCVNFISVQQRIYESIFGTFVGLFALYRAYSRIELRAIPHTEKYDSAGKRILLVSMSLIFGMELAYKFATKSMIWVLNPCHIATMFQIFILAAPPGRAVTAAFRLHLHMLTGAPIAILFPVVNTRLLPFETEVYFIQHVLMIIIPLYLMKLGGVYTAERLTDFSWASVSCGILFIYHFLPLQYLAYVSKVNLNNMLCPAISDPFYGPYYRLFAMTHEVILLHFLGKIFVLIGYLYTDPCEPYKDSKSLEDKNNVIAAAASSNGHLNGHLKAS